MRHPDDKAAVEGTVKWVSTWITAALRDRKFFSLAEAKEAARQSQSAEVDAETPANGGLLANAKISADALKKLTESEE